MHLIEEDLKNLSGIEFFLNHDLSSFTTMKLKSNGHLIKVKNIEALKNVLLLMSKFKIQYRVLGWGANTLIPEVNQDLIYLKLEFKQDTEVLNEARELYHLPASLSLNLMTAHALKFGINGWEVLTGIPATLGGAIFMNAGTKFGDISLLIKEVEIMDNWGQIRNHKVDKDSFSYRKNHFIKQGDVILSALVKSFGIGDDTVKNKILEYSHYRKKTQPLNTKNCGCVFKNINNTSAGMIIDLLGLKGFYKNALKISHIHGNFIENSGGATLDDFLDLTGAIQSVVEMNTGIKFELEVSI